MFEAADLNAARQKFVFDAQSMLLECYTQKEGKSFCVLSPSGERFMIPAKYVEELQRLTKSNWPMRLGVNLGQDTTLIETLFGGGQGFGQNMCLIWIASERFIPNGALQIKGASSLLLDGGWMC